MAEARKVDLSAIKACISGGAPLPAEVRIAFENTTGGKLVEGYGLSEASPIITCNPIISENKGALRASPSPARSSRSATATIPTG